MVVGLSHRLTDGAKDLNELENQALKEAGGTINQGGNTYNIRQVPGY